MPPLPQPLPTLEVQSDRVAQRYPGLGRWLGIAVLAQLLVPFMGAAIFTVLHKLTGDPAFDKFGDWVVTFFGLGVLLSPVTVTLSLMASGTTFSRTGAARVAARGAGLMITRGGRERFIPRQEILDGLLLPAWRPRVQLQLTRGRTLEVDVPDEEQGARLLAALGIGPEQRRVSVQLGSPNGQIAAGCVGLPAAMLVWAFAVTAMKPMINPFAGPVWVLLVLLSVWLLRRVFQPSEVVVGSDGLRVKTPFSTQWVPFTELEYVWTKDDRITLGRKGQRALLVRASGELRDGLAHRIRETRARSLAAEGAARGAAALERQGRPLAAWRAGLRGLLQQEGGYRAAALNAEDVMAVLESPEAPRERRIGAALALKEAGHPEARARIRVAAETSADEELRAALEQAAEEEISDEALERALR